MININGDKVEVLHTNHYINISTYKNGKQIQTLYKIYSGAFEGQFVLTPLNTLESNEFGNTSSNSNNSKHYFPDFYESFITDWLKNIYLNTIYQ